MEIINEEMSKNIYTHTSIDRETGEVIQAKFITKTKIKTEERFFKTYLDDLSALINCTNSEKNFILCSMQKGYIGFETNEIVLTKTRKEAIAECSGTNLKSVHNCLYRLLKKNIIIRHKGNFYLNPKMFFTGDEMSRGKMFELKLKYNL